MKFALCVLLLAALAHARVERVYPRRSLARGSTNDREISHQHEHKTEHQPLVEAHDHEHKEASHKEEALESKIEGGQIEYESSGVKDDVKIEHVDHSGVKQGRYQTRHSRQASSQYSYGGGISSGNSGESFEHSSLSDNNFAGYYPGFRGGYSSEIY